MERKEHSLLWLTDHGHKGGNIKRYNSGGKCLEDDGKHRVARGRGMVGLG